MRKIPIAEYVTSLDAVAILGAMNDAGVDIDALGARDWSAAELRRGWEEYLTWRSAKGSASLAAIAEIVVLTRGGSSALPRKWAHARPWSSSLAACDPASSLGDWGSRAGTRRRG